MSTPVDFDFGSTMVTFKMPDFEQGWINTPRTIPFKSSGAAGNYNKAKKILLKSQTSS
jgi:hypothetical protein